MGTDALAVVVSAANDFIEDVTLDELRLLFSTAVNWSDVRPSWPDEPILRFVPGTDSGTFDYFVEAVMGDDPSLIVRSTRHRFSEDDNLLVQGVESSPYAIGFFGFAYYQENRAGLRSIGIEGVLPTADSVEEGRYPLARPLFIYSTAQTLAAKPHIADFIAYYLTHVEEEILDVGYFPASETALWLAQARWLAAMGRAGDDVLEALQEATAQPD